MSGAQACNESIAAKSAGAPAHLQWRQSANARFGCASHRPNARFRRIYSSSDRKRNRVLAKPPIAAARCSSTRSPSRGKMRLVGPTISRDRVKACFQTKRSENWRCESSHRLVAMLIRREKAGGSCFERGARTFRTQPFFISGPPCRTRRCRPCTVRPDDPTH